MWVVLWGLLLRLPWRTWVCPSEAQVWMWCSCLGCRVSGSTRYSGGLMARVVGSIVFSKVWQPVLPNTLQCSCLENPLDREARQATVCQVAKSWKWLKRPCMHRRKIFLACGSSVPVRVEHEDSVAAWLEGTLAVQSGLPQPQELWPYQSLFLSLL